MDIEDNISIASTVENGDDSDAEWDVKQILAEGQVGGRTRYLIEWEDFPLSAASWEPEENFQASLLEEWYRTKQLQQEGKAPRFHIDEWRMALIQHFRDKYARHDMRNRERLRCGLEPTCFNRTLEDLIAEVNATPSDQPKVIGDDAHQPLADLTLDSASRQPAAEGRPRRSSIDDLFSDAESDIETDQASIFYEHLNQEEGPATPNTNAARRCTGDTVAHSEGQQPEHQQRLLAGIAIEPAGINPSRTTFANGGSGSLTLENKSDVGSDLGSDAMDIDDASGNTSPVLPASSRFDENPTSSPRKRLGIEHDTIIEDLRQVGKARTVPGSKAEDKDKNGVNKNLSKPSIKTSKRVSFSLETPAKVTQSPRAEPSLFVSDPDHKEASPVPAPNRVSPTRPSSNPIEKKEKKGRDDFDKIMPKTCVLGSTKLTCSFQASSRPQDSQVSFYETLMALETFNFSHICTAQDFIRQLRAAELSSGFWITGSAWSHNEATKLELILDYLHSSSFGLLCHNNDLCLLIYPNKSADWQQSPLPTASLPAGHSLRYLAFATALNFKVNDMELEFNLQYPSGVGIFDKQLCTKLIPSNDQSDKTQPTPDSFFLIFPPSAKPEEDLLCRWLKIFSRNCEVRSCVVPGHWAKFLEGFRGAVILHQDCIQSLHRLPHFSKLLHSRNENYNFWIFRLPFCSPISEPESMDEYLDQVGIALDWAFPPGVAIMAPPSFFVSQPMQAYNLLKWIWQNYSDEAQVYRHGKLVVCHDIDEWLLCLALEKREANIDMREPKHILEVRMKTVMLMRKLLGQEPGEITSPIVYAPVYIDGHDEQSLVNWFAWWSITQVDQFRKFSVICSDSNNEKRLSRHLKKSTLQELFSKTNGSRSARLDTNHADFQLIPDDTLQSISTFIRGVSNEAHAGSWNPLVICPWVIHRYEGSSRYGDASQWVSFFAEKYIVRRLESKGHGIKNTQIGFFYTADDTQDQLDASDPQLSHPWLACVRPMELHRKPWKNSELLIWDYRLRDVSRRQQTIAESDLSPAQRDLITEVTKQYARMNLPLAKVWAGGFKASKGYSLPLDITLDWMKAMIANVKSWLPLNHDDVLNRGWSLVRSRSSPSMSISPGGSRSTEPSRTEGAIEPDAAGESKRILFNPPNASSGNPQPYLNRLYQWAMASRVHDESEYIYVPTIEWYKEQHESGRGFEHIRMWPWREFFEHYGIDNPEK